METTAKKDAVPPELRKLHARLLAVRRKRVAVSAATGVALTLALAIALLGGK